MIRLEGAIPMLKSGVMLMAAVVMLSEYHGTQRR